MSDKEDQDADVPGPSGEGASRGRMVRLDTVMSEGGERYDVLPLPSPSCEVDNTSFLPAGYKPRIPYMSIYSSPSRMIVGVGSSYLAKTPVKVKVLEAKRDSTYRNILYPTVYALEVTHGQFTWVIYRRYNNFLELHEKLWAYRTSMKIPLPSKSHRQRRKTRHGMSKEESKIPRFPKRPEMWVSTEAQNKRNDQLTLYLNAMLESPLYKSHHATKKFLEVSRLSFIQDLGIKGKEGLIKKRSGGHKIDLYVCGRCCDACEMFARWSERWFVVKDSFILYMDPNREKIKGVLLFDNLFSISHQKPSSSIILNNTSRSLMLDCGSDRQALDWKKAIEHCVKNTSDGLTESEIRLGSFAPQRPDSYAHWFIDGREFMATVADSIEKAREEIFITDWWLSPEIYMKRPMTQGDHWRLDKLLQRKADEGVKIYVQLYKEVEVAVGLDSAYTKRTLQELNPKNIKVMRHPDLTAGELLWAHHEKIIVIDQNVAFIGGIDLCYGRWDDHAHRLTDVTALLTQTQQGGTTEVDSSGQTVNPQTAAMGQSSTAAALGMFWAMTMGVVEHVSETPETPKIKEPPPTPEPAREGNRLKKLLSFRSRHKDRKSESEEPRSARREADTLNISTLGGGYGATNDSAPLITSKSSSGMSGRRSPSPKRKSTDTSARNGHAKEGRGANYLQTYQQMVSQVEKAGKSRLWIGKDYNNFIAKDLTNLDDPFEDVLDRMTTPRMPWHDIASVTYGKAARDAARHFIQRWNFTKIQKKKKGEDVPFLLPKSYSDEAFTLPPDLIHPEAVKANVQVLRSSSEWSAGICEVDRSIQNAYLYAIEKSEHFIYLENQFFITCRDNHQVRNSICEALYQRIVRAHNQKKNFRVYVVMPLIPGFEGDISDSSKSQAIRTVLHWQYKSINRGVGSLLEDLNQTIGAGNAWKYVSFCGLRTHSELQDKPITEMIYVHSKMLIADDRLVIIGSANINDRSMSGTRDSEVALLVEDTQMIPSTMDGKPYEVGVYATSLRRRCFCEHLGLLPSDYDGTKATFDPLTADAGLSVADASSEHFFKEIWTRIAAVNTTVYEKVFKCLPSDFVRKLPDAEEFSREALCETDVGAAREELTKVNGYLVLMPLLFLIDEDLTPGAITKEGIAPTDLWT
uniref:Phospholipase n=1 Tax=Phallusia mammillata TaxID=59560 RepID=A0A6F9DPM1_9ASCI|nr:phospholipase D1-like [Phallusia mammillata]